MHAVGGHNLPGIKKEFLDIETVVLESTVASKPMEFVPHGVKEDQYKQENSKLGNNWDNCGAWERISRG